MGACTLQIVQTISAWELQWRCIGALQHMRCLHTFTSPALCPCRELAEDERASAFWNAPFALLVQDDSKEAMLEYANKQVSVTPWREKAGKGGGACGCGKEG